MKKLMLVLPILMIAACAAPRKHILSAGMVSMTERVAPTETLKDAGPVTGTYCAGDKEGVKADDGNIGLIDEAVRRAQSDSKARYIKNAQFYSQGACVSVEGTAIR